MYLDSRLWQFTAGVRLRILAAVAVGLVAAAVGIARFALLGWLIARLFGGDDFATLAVPFLAVAAVMLLRGWLEHARAMIAHETAARVQIQLRRRLHDQVVALGPAHFGAERTGDVILAMIDGVEQLETYFGQYLPQLCVAVLTPLGVFAFLAFLDVPVALVLLASALFTLVAPQVFHRWDSRSSRARQRAFAAYGAEFLDSLQGLATLKAFGQSGARARMLAEKARRLFRSTMWLLATNALGRGITDIGIAVGTAATLGLGAYRVAAGEMAMSVLLIVLMMGIEAYRPLRDLRGLLHQGMMGQSAAIAMFGVLDGRPQVTDSGTGAKVPAELAPTVEFRDVRFAYPGGRRPAHRGLTFAVGAGERVAVVGASGAGKSTVVRLLLRLHDPDSGVVLVGGRDLRELPLAELRRRLAVVSQDTYLFFGTVAENLRLGRPEAGDAELEAAARAANAHDFIVRLPHGYETVVGERGIRLSGGQRQRIAIARALLRDAPILVLDEALSAVDAENEAVIQQALDRLMKGRTTLVFAHRLSSVIGADRILVLDEGRVVEEGGHAELTARRGAYWRLMSEQASDTGGGEVLIVDRAGEPDIEALSPTAWADAEPADGILRAEGLGWIGAIRALFGMVASYRGRLAATFVLGVARVAALIGVGVFGALVVAALKAGAPFAHHLVALFVAAPLAGILHWAESWCAHDMAYRLLSELRISLFDKLDRLAPAYLLRRRSGDLVAMATQDVDRIEYFFAHTIAPAFVAVLVPLGVLATLAAHGPSLAAALAPFLLVVGASPFLGRHRIDTLGSRAQEKLGDLNAHAVDTIQGLAEIVAFQQERARGGAFLARVAEHHRLRLAFFRDVTLQTAILETVTGLGGLAVIVAGARMIGAGELESGILPLLTLLAMAAFLPVSEIASIARQLADTLGAARRLHAVHREPEAVVDGPGAPSPIAGGASVAVEGVRFTYPSGTRPALADISLAAPAGSTLAVVGSSGAGKTTLATLLMRFFDPDAGTIRLGGHDLREFRLDELRRQIALVAQDTFLFNDTLRANILIARPGADAADVALAVERAALKDFVATLPDGLDTRVGERGMQLSGGQRQRVAIARAFLKDAAVLILDEATSHLDAVSERLVRRALDELMAHRTTIVIAHRLSTVRDADQIVVLDSGRMVEAGTHAELLAARGLYARLVRRQIVGAAAD